MASKQNIGEEDTYKTYKFAIFNNSTNRRVISFNYRSSRMVMWIFITIILLFVAFWALVAFTPLKHTIPGFQSESVRENVIRTVMKTDSLSREIEQWEKYLASIRASVEKSAVPIAEVETDSPLAKDNTKSEVADSILDSKLLSQIQFATENESQSINRIEELYFFKPVKGVISQKFNTLHDHFAIDIATAENEAVCSVLNGTVVFASWTDDAGYILFIQHTNNILSVYKHCSSILAKVGDKVRAGSVIGMVGGVGGNLSTGTHLHFELWHGGQAVDPERVIRY